MKSPPTGGQEQLPRAAIKCFIRMADEAAKAAVRERSPWGRKSWGGFHAAASEMRDGGYGGPLTENEWHNIQYMAFNLAWEAANNRGVWSMISRDEEKNHDQARAHRRRLETSGLIGADLVKALFEYAKFASWDEANGGCWREHPNAENDSRERRRWKQKLLADCVAPAPTLPGPASPTAVPASRSSPGVLGGLIVLFVATVCGLSGQLLPDMAEVPAEAYGGHGPTEPSTPPRSWKTTAMAIGMGIAVVAGCFLAMVGFLGSRFKANKERTTVVLVEQFDSTPTTYPERRCGFGLRVGRGCLHDGVRLRVGQGCLHDGEVAGPVTILTSKRFFVEYNGEMFLVSAVVDCQPSGARFGRPLELDFFAGKGAEHGKKLEDTKDTLMVFWRENAGQPWKLVDDQELILDDELPLFVRANIDHFSQGCIGKRISFQNARQDRTIWWIGSPHKNEIEFINTTPRRLYFLVVPASCTDDHVTRKITVHFEACGIGLTAAIARDRNVIPTSAGRGCQWMAVPAADGEVTPGRSYPFVTCQMPKWGGGEVRVALVTATEDEGVRMWFSAIFKERTESVILPRMFELEQPVSVIPPAISNRDVDHSPEAARIAASHQVQ